MLSDLPQRERSWLQVNGYIESVHRSSPTKGAAEVLTRPDPVMFSISSHHHCTVSAALRGSDSGLHAWQLACKDSELLL